MKRKLGIFLAAVLTLTSVMSVMAAEPVAEEVVSEIIEAEGTAMDEVSVQDESENAFTITVGTETKQYPADKFIEVMDAATKAADADTEIKVSLSADIDTNKAPVVIWGGKVDLNLGGNTLTAGGESVYKNRDPKITDYTAWEEYTGGNVRAYSAVIVAPGKDSSASLTLSGTGRLTTPVNTEGVGVARNCALTVDRGVVIASLGTGIDLFEATATVKGKIDIQSGKRNASGIFANNSDVNIEGAEISVKNEDEDYTSHGVYLYSGSRFSMRGGNITVDTNGTAIGILKSSGTGKFTMSGVKATSTAKDDIQITATGEDPNNGGWPASCCVYVDDYMDTENPAYIKNVKAVATTEGSPYVDGIRFENGPGTSVLIENCDVKCVSTYEPEDEHDTSDWVTGIMNFVTEWGEENFSSQIRNVVVNCEGTGKIEGIRGYNVDGADVTVRSTGWFNSSWIYGILTQGEQEITVKNCKVYASTDANVGIYGLDNWRSEKKVHVGKNCEFETVSGTSYSANALSGVNASDPDNMPYIAEDGKWFDKDGKQLSFKEVAEAKYVRTTKSKKTDPTPTNTKTALSKLKFTWNESNQGSAKSPYLTYDGTEKKLGFKLETSDGTALAEDTDYTVTYTHSKKDFTKPGVVTVKIKAAEGSEQYKGTLTKKYSIKPAKLADILDDPNKSDDDGNLLSVEVNESSPVTYDPKGARPSVKLIYDGNVLEAGKDYKVVKYLRNKSAAEATATNPPMVQILGKGNFTGTVKIAFTIEPKYVDTELLDITVKDILSDWHPGKFKSKPVIKDGKKKLKEGRDYKVKYSLSSNMIAEIPDDGKVDEGKEVFVEISGVGNYQSSTVVSYFVRYAMLNKCSAKVKEGVHLPASADDITPEMLTVIKDKASKMELIPDTDYLITGAQYITGKTDYLKVTIVGGTNKLYGGEKTLKIKLIKK